MTPCPDREVLHRLLNDGLVDTEFDELDRHVQECASCQEILDKLCDDTLWKSDLRQEASMLLSDAGREPTVDPLAVTDGVARGNRDRSARTAPKVAGYEITDELGRGGMGVVYRALDEKRGVPVALKTLRAAGASSILRLKQEFRALTDVSHPNLVALYELATDGPLWFFTMELIEGVDFLHFVRSTTLGPAAAAQTTEAAEPLVSPPTGALPLTGDVSADSRALDLTRSKVGPHALTQRESSLSPVAVARLRIALRQLAEGVAFLHQAGKLHRDLKPSNVLVTRHGRLVILDFGLAADLGASGLHQSSLPYVLGTCGYMSPEQAAGRPVSPASDWYSFGSMLYEALTGYSPFLGSTADVLLDKQRFEPPAPCEVASGVPADLNALCVDLLRRDPQARPAGRDVLRRLNRLTGETGQAALVQPSGPQFAPLVSRIRELELLKRAFTDVVDGQTVALYVHGPSGIGKTALLRHYLDDLAGRDRAIVLSGRCYQQESVPYKAFDTIVDALSQYLNRLPLGEAQAALPDDVRSLARVFPVLREVQAMRAEMGRSVDVPDPRELRRRAFRACASCSHG